MSIGDFLRASGKHVGSRAIHHANRAPIKAGHALSKLHKQKKARAAAEQKRREKERKAQIAKDIRNDKRYNAAAKKTAKTGRNHFKFVRYE